MKSNVKSGARPVTGNNGGKKEWTAPVVTELNQEIDNVMAGLGIGADAKLVTSTS
ncbi:MAG: hypothetical protein AAFX04_03705 [Pseudomonadota bacterium]